MAKKLHHVNKDIQLRSEKLGQTVGRENLDGTLHASLEQGG